MSYNVRHFDFGRKERGRSGEPVHESDCHGATGQGIAVFMFMGRGVVAPLALMAVKMDMVFFTCMFMAMHM